MRLLAKLKEKIFPTIPEDYEEDRNAARKGAELLDEYSPGWATLINTSKLNIRSPEDCILGQVYGDYRLGLESLDITHPEGSSSNGFVGGSDEQTKELEHAWRTEVARRL